MRTPNIPNYLLYFRDDMRLSTWILWGACIQSLLILFLPRFLALLPAAAVLITRIITSTLRNEGFLPHSGFDKVALGRTTAQIPNADGSFSKIAGDKEIVLFIIATRSSHPKGRFAPGINEITNYFRDLWQELGRNREKWGYLGKTPTLIATEEDCSNTLVWISYWKSLEHLHAFAQGDKHQTGLKWWNGEKKYPHIAIQHETYVVPGGHWENIAHNFRPFGIGQTKHVVRDHPTDKESRLISPRIPTTGAAWKSMKSRMGRVE